MADLGKGREAVTNYIGVCNSIADSYPDGITHGLQKDAIQNSLDARKGKGAVHVEFEVVSNEHGTFLTFRDSHTTGLTGEIVRAASDYETLKPDDHWARFEAFAYTKDNPDALGARGQGKFIFLQASKQYKMFYDTLRHDGVYRLGATQATKTGRPVYPEFGEKWEDEKAQDQLIEHCGLEPLEAVGTRIIVCEPLPKVLEDFSNGNFERAIQETWFRAIEKAQLKVWLKQDNESKEICVPKPYPLPDADAPKTKTWIYEKDFQASDISSSDGTFKIKAFRAVYFKSFKIPEEFQGVAIVQNGMKISSLNMDMAPAEVREKITGYIEFDKSLDRELRKGKNQHPNHYDLKWRSTTPRAIKQFIKTRLEEFGREKLGIGEDDRKRQKRYQRNAEKEAMELLRRFASDIDLKSRKPGPGPEPPVEPPPEPPEPPPHQEVGLLARLQFPDRSKKPRVDWGESLLLSIHGFNRTEEHVQGLLSVRVLQADTLIEDLASEVPAELPPSDGTSPSTVRLGDASPYAIGIDPSTYGTLGEYRIRAVLIAHDGTEIDVRTMRFWVGENPPRKMPFDLEPAALPTQHAWQPSGDLDHDPVIYYNTNHPEYKYLQDDEDEQASYLFNICLEGALHFILTRPYDEQQEADYHPLDTDKIVSSQPDEMPEKVYEEVSKYIATVRWRRYEE